jgi:hypothetical protein
LNGLKRFAALRHGLSNRIDGLNEIFAFGLVQRFEQFEILKIEHVVNNDGIVERLLGKVAEPVCRMLSDPFGPLLFTPSEDLLSKQQLFFFGNFSRIELVERCGKLFDKSENSAPPRANRSFVLRASCAEAVAKKSMAARPPTKFATLSLKAPAPLTYNVL